MKLRPIVLVLCAALVFAVAGCGGGSSDSSSATGKSSEASGGEESSGSSETSSSAQKTKPTVTVPTEVGPSKFAIKEIEEGSGAEAKSGDQVTVQYVGVGYNSKKEFDSSWSRNKPFSFTLGAGEVIKGWERGVEGMKVGGRREMLIPANLGYGAEGSPPKIAPNEALVFVVDLLSIK